MPFTLAHPAAALPLKRLLGRRAVASALAIGSLVPDLPYFLPLGEGVGRMFAHRPAALVWFCLPVALALWLLFEAALRQPLTALLPAALRDRLPAASSFRWRGIGWPGVALSALLGAATHLAWDAFTKEQSPLVDAVPALQAPLFEVGGDTLHLYRLVQHASTVAGLSLLALWTLRWWRRTPARPARAPTVAARPRAAALLLVAVAAWAALAAVQVVGPPTSLLDLRSGLRVAAVEGLRALGVAMLTWAAVWHLRRRAAPQAAR